MGRFTPEQLQAEQLRQLREEGLRFYKPHPRQLEFHQLKQETRSLLGGNRSGKSWAGIMEDCFVTGKVHPWRPNKVGTVKTRVCCSTFGLLYDNLIPLLKSTVPRHRCSLDWKTYEGIDAQWPGIEGGKWDSAFDKERLILYLADGSSIDLKSYSQDREVFQGVTRDFTHFDEEPPRDIFEESLLRHASSRTGIDMIFTLTMINYSQWLYNHIYDGAVKYPDRIAYVLCDLRENPHVNETTVLSVQDSITDDAIREARISGRPTVISGRVHKAYGAHNLIDFFMPPREWHHSLVIDPHPEKPSGVLFISEDMAGRLYAWKEMLVKGDVEHQCKEIKSQMGDYNFDLMLMDPSSRQRATTRGKPERLIDEFRAFMPWIVEANNNREVGIERFNRMAKDGPNGPRLYTMRSCPITHHQIMNYMYKPPLKSGEVRGKAEVFKRDDEFPDCYRYRVMYGETNDMGEFDGWNVGGMIANG